MTKIVESLKESYARKDLKQKKEAIELAYWDSHQ